MPIVHHMKTYLPVARRLSGACFPNVLPSQLDFFLPLLFFIRFDRWADKLFEESHYFSSRNRAHVVFDEIANLLFNCSSSPTERKLRRLSRAKENEQKNICDNILGKYLIGQVSNYVLERRKGPDWNQF